MKINEVEALVAITKENMLFFQQQGILSQRRKTLEG